MGWVIGSLRLKGLPIVSAAKKTRTILLGKNVLIFRFRELRNGRKLRVEERGAEWPHRGKAVEKSNNQEFLTK